MLQRGRLVPPPGASVQAGLAAKLRPEVRLRFWDRGQDLLEVRLLVG